jgi:hypothetical protein
LGKDPGFSGRHSLEENYQAELVKEAAKMAARKALLGPNAVTLVDKLPPAASSSSRYSREVRGTWRLRSLC